MQLCITIREFRNENDLNIESKDASDIRENENCPTLHRVERKLPEDTIVLMTHRRRCVVTSPPVKLTGSPEYEVLRPRCVKESAARSGAVRERKVWIGKYIGRMLRGLTREDQFPFGKESSE